MALIVITVIIIYFILIAWTWQSLSFVEIRKKVIFLIIGLVIMYGITLSIFQIAKKGINYENPEMQKEIQNILVAVFTGINGMILMPQIARIWDKIKTKEIEKEKVTKRIIILVILFMICLIFETNSMKGTQESILKMYGRLPKRSIPLAMIKE